MSSIHESDQLAEDQTQEYVDKFNNLSKYSQMLTDQIIRLDGWEYALDKIDSLWECGDR